MSRLTRSVFWVMVLVGIVLAVAPGFGATWSLAGDWSIASNPNGNWSYGWASKSDFEAGPGYTLNLDVVSGTAGPSFPLGWSMVQWWAPAALTQPMIFCNPTDSDALSPGNWGNIPAYTVAMHPGMTGERCIARWGCPSDGVVSVRGSFTPSNFGKTDLTILLNGTQLWREFAAPPDTTPFEINDVVAGGDIVDFALGWGIDNTFSGDTTCVVADIELLTGYGIIKGQVTANVAGSPPVAWATVRDVNNVFSTTVTAPDGTYSLALPGGQRTVEVSCENYQTATSVVSVLSGTKSAKDFSLSLIPGKGIVSGLVTANDPGNAPVVGATLSVPVAGDTQSTVTNADGQYLMILDVGDYSLEASGYRYVTITEPVTIVSQAGVTKNFSLTTPPGTTYYVKADGDDSLSGTSIVEAWKTIDRGVYSKYDNQDPPQLLWPAVLGPGDTVLVQPGMYPVYGDEGAWQRSAGLLRASGRPYHPLTYIADNKVPGDRVLIYDDQNLDDRKYGMAVQGAHDVVVDGFEFSGCSIGVMVQGTSADVLVQNCYVHDLTSITLYPSEGCAGFQDVWGADNTTYFHNVVVSDSGLASDVGVYTDANSNAKIYNNTFVGLSQGVFIGNSLGGTNVANNIITDSKFSGINSVYGDVGFSHSYNLFYNNPDDVIGTSLGTGEFNIDPMFVDAAGRDYHLASGSPAINTGLDVGLPFTGPAPDRGAFESSSTTPASGIRGTVTANTEEHTPIPGAVVSSSSGVWSTTAADGTYWLVLPPGTYTVDVSYPDAAPALATITVQTEETVVHDFVLSALPGVTYYVKPTGDDDADGLSLQTAWASIDNGDRLKQLKANDTILVQPGTYSLWTAVGGKTAADIRMCGGNMLAPITYKAETASGRVLINGNNAAGVTMGIHVATTAATYIVIDGFEVIGCFHGVFVSDGANHVKVKNCLVHDSNQATYGYSTGFCDAYNNSDNTYCNNVVYGKAAAVDDRGFYTTGNCSNLKIYNNTFVSTSTGALMDTSPNSSVVNNIITESKVQALSYNRALAHSHNLFYNNVVDYGSGASPGVAEFNADPLFVNASGRDYHLQAGSLAINSGVDVGLPFTPPAPDRGAFESASTTPIGLVTGIVNSSELGNPSLSGAKVGLLDNSVWALTDQNGSYTLALAPGSQTLMASKTGYETAQATVAVVAGTTKTQNFTLDLPGAAYTRILDIKRLDPGTSVRLTDAKVSTAASGTFSDGSYYIEEPDRSCGIKVVPRSGVTAVSLGDSMTLTGIVANDANGEKYIDATSVSPTPGIPLGPLGINNRTVSGTGTSTSGLLVTIWGRVTFKGANYIYVDDGSAVNDGSGVAVGVRVMLSGLTSPITKDLNGEPYVAITGLAGLAKEGTTIISAIRPRGDTDVIVNP
ncbi:MAG: carboxypeptidase regulatory-like domain-containing protein [Armatimonadetes bacterium]|nr:carboxypeptidase regulatory-like domain-containing protein [Armatimonadota bacterium]